jgi:hypothetical protein
MIVLEIKRLSPKMDMFLETGWTIFIRIGIIVPCEVEEWFFLLKMHWKFNIVEGNMFGLTNGLTVPYNLFPTQNNISTYIHVFILTIIFCRTPFKW